MDPDLLAAIRSAITEGEVIATVAKGKPNRIVQITADGLWVETEKSDAEGTGAQPVPAWMFDVAWDHLQQHRTLTQEHLLNTLNVKRSAAVCAVLARLPAVEVVSVSPTVLGLRRTP